MEKEFVSYELAVKLKPIEFDEPCFAFYQKEYAEVTPTMVDDNEQYKLTGFRTCKNSEIPQHYTSAPTYSQAFRWFREKHHLIGTIEYVGGAKYETTWWDICVVGHFNVNPSEWTMKYQPYEQAELACLQKLIEIVKNKAI